MSKPDDVVDGVQEAEAAGVGDARSPDGEVCEEEEEEDPVKILMATLAEGAEVVGKFKAAAEEFEAATRAAGDQAREAEAAASRTAVEAKTARVEDAFVAATAASEAAEQSSRAAAQAFETYEELPDPETIDFEEPEEKEAAMQARAAVEQIAKDAKKCSERAAAEAKAAQAVAEAARAAEMAASEKATLWVEARKLTLTDEIECAVVWLHGQGEIEASWPEMLSSIQVPKEAGPCRWIWPRAEFSPCSSRGGAMTLQWFDTFEFPVCRLIRGVPDRARLDDDSDQLTSAVKNVHAVIAALEAEGISSRRIVVGGFGQGGALAAHTVLRYDRPLAGAAILSGWIPCLDALEMNATDSGRTTEVLWVHGARDAMVEPRTAVDQTRALENFGAHVEWRLMPELGSGINAEVLGILEGWLSKRLVGDAQKPADHEMMTIDENEELDPEEENNVAPT